MATKNTTTGQVKTPAAAKPKRKPNAAFMASMLCSAELKVIVGDKPLPRTEITKAVWEYIKQHGLQDKVNRKQINPDAVLGAVIGSEPVTMFAMTRLIGKHILGAAE